MTVGNLSSDVLKQWNKNRLKRFKTTDSSVKNTSIVISGPAAVGKTTLAERLAKIFGYTVFNGGDILKNIAREKGYNVTGKDWWDTAEAVRFMDERKNDVSFDIKVDKMLVEIANSGKVVITSYTLPWLTQQPMTFWLNASRESRSKRMANRDAISITEALKIIKNRDTENRRIYKKIYGPRFGDNLLIFDVVLNTELYALDSLVYISQELYRRADS
jgi:CMP/dCMP kinase